MFIYSTAAAWFLPLHGLFKGNMLNQQDLLCCSIFIRIWKTIYQKMKIHYPKNSGKTIL